MQLFHLIKMTLWNVLVNLGFLSMLQGMKQLSTVSRCRTIDFKKRLKLYNAVLPSEQQPWIITGLIHNGSTVAVNLSLYPLL